MFWGGFSSFCKWHSVTDGANDWEVQDLLEDESRPFFVTKLGLWHEPCLPDDEDAQDSIYARNDVSEAHWMIDELTSEGICAQIRATTGVKLELDSVDRVSYRQTLRTLLALRCTRLKKLRVSKPRAEPENEEDQMITKWTGRRFTLHQYLLPAPRPETSTPASTSLTLQQASRSIPTHDRRWNQ